MSNKINSKDIINKQKEKFSDSPWANFLLSEFDKPEFTKLLNQLIDEVSKGKSFTPPMKSWFTEFSTMNPDNIKVVFVSKEPKFLDMFAQKVNSIEELNNQGVMFHSLARTSIDNKPLMESWRIFNINFLDYLITTKQDVLFMFVGIDAAEYADIIPTGTNHNKCFLPDIDSSFWNTDMIHKLLTTSVNSLLDSKEIDTINW